MHAFTKNKISLLIKYKLSNFFLQNISRQTLGTSVDHGDKQMKLSSNSQCNIQKQQQHLISPHNIQEIKIYNNSTDDDRGAGCPSGTDYVLQSFPSLYLLVSLRLHKRHKKLLRVIDRGTPLRICERFSQNFILDDYLTSEIWLH